MFYKGHFRDTKTLKLSIKSVYIMFDKSLLFFLWFHIPNLQIIKVSLKANSLYFLDSNKYEVDKYKSYCPNDKHT